MAILEPLASLIISILFIVVGLIVAYAGGVLVRSIFAIAGAIVGGSLGYAGGTLLGDFTMSIILAIVGAILLAALFTFLVRLGLALVVGVLPAWGVYIYLGGTTGGLPEFQATATIAAIVVFIVAAVIAYALYKPLLGMVTALFGGLLVGVSVNSILLNPAGLDSTISAIVAIVVGAAVFIGGAIRQSRAS